MAKIPTTQADSASKPVKAEQAVATKTSQAKPKTPPAEAKISAPKPAVAKAPAKPVAEKVGISTSENIGIAAGSIWQYLDSNGATTIAKLVRELAEDEKTVQRGIGWLTREDKVSITVINRFETVALKG